MEKTWSHDFYRETDPAKRQQILKAHAGEEEAWAEEYRNRLWTARYGKYRLQKDKFVKCLMELKYLAEGSTLDLGGDRRRMGARILSALCLAEAMQSEECYQRDPVLVINFYNERRKQLLEVKPNRGHELLAELEKSFHVTVVTQNVDNLHERAGSSHIIHLHGELTKVCSSRDPYNPQFIKELKPEEYEVKMGDKAGDGTQLRPFIVWFGEAVPEIETAIRYVEKADIFVIIGTSLNVYPAAGLLHYVPRGAEVYLIDPKPVDTHTSRSIHVIQKGASEGMGELKQLLGV